MGAIRSSIIKKVARELVEKYPDQFSVDFNNNKEKVMLYSNVQTKKIRNVLAGYVTTYWRNKYQKKPRKEEIPDIEEY